MSRAYVEIAFTPAVRKVQEEQGSREQYAFLDDAPERGDQLTEREAAFIETRDTMFLATVSETGWPYVQHRGGPAGFVKVLDPKTLGFADFRGNVQYISVGNLLRDERIALILIDFAKQRRLKLYGRVRLVDVNSDPEMMSRLQLSSYRAHVERAFVVNVEAFDWNCPQHITPRFTEDEIASMMTPLRLRAEKAERSLTERGGQQVRDLPGELGSGPLQLIVSGVRQLTPAVRAFELRAVDGASLPRVRAGAHLSVPVRLASGQEATRRYSVVRAAPEGDLYEIAVLRDERGSGGSNAVHTDFRLGTRLRCGLPENYFPLVPVDRPIVLVAGGIGITPIRAMATELRARGSAYVVNYAVRSLAEAPYLSELRAENGEDLTIHSSAEGARMNIPEVVRLAVQNDADLYVCGPARMIDGFRQAVIEQGFDVARLHVESFSSAAVKVGDRPIEVSLRRSGKKVRVAPGQSILEAVEKAGIAAPFGCRTGSCGACVVKVVQGEPEHRDSLLSTTERRQAGVMCICVSRAVGDSLEIDL